jgi:hypothetical protein
VTEEQEVYLRCERLALEAECLRMTDLVAEARSRIGEIDRLLTCRFGANKRALLAALPAPLSGEGVTVRRIAPVAPALKLSSAQVAVYELEQAGLCQAVGLAADRRARLYQRTADGERVLRMGVGVE